ncbi:MAG: hypothetical protein DMD63_06345 [Gemmatimonadetes bacterium]|nr:MAG: hypothetical protein DMD63_06345 [Gemmatimonadota bacterium]
MTTIINVPHSLEDKSFEQVLEQVAPLPIDEKIIVDTRHARWASPYGLTALLALAQSRAERPITRGRAVRDSGSREVRQSNRDERAS